MTGPMNPGAHWVRALAALLLAMPWAGARADPDAGTPVRLRTNLGHDLDDAFALAFAAAHPEIDLKAITATGENAHGSARIAARFLWLTGNDSVTVSADGPRVAGPNDPGGLFQFGLRPSRNRPGNTPGDGGAAVVDLSATRRDGDAEISPEALEKLFECGTPMANALRSLHELSGRRRPSLGGARRIAAEAGIDLSETAFVELIAAWKSHNVIGNRALNPLRNVSRPLEEVGFPGRVHAAENFETDIERHRWLSGREIDEEGGSRSLRGMLTRNFDGKMGDPTRLYRAAIFNPVPGPPMGPNTRLRFRYRIEGANWLQCQLFTLSKGYHRYTSIENLPEGEWRTATVDMTKARRPDGGGGPLSTDERIDDIQFYTDPGAELHIDDIVLYDAAADAPSGRFPEEVIFTGWFDTGKQGDQWPGDFEIVPHKKPRTWKAARSVPDPVSKSPWIRVGLRGPRPAAGDVRVDFDYRFRGSGPIRVSLANTEARLNQPATGKWTEASLTYELSQDSEIGEIQFRIPPGAELEIDNLLIYRPAG